MDTVQCTPVNNKFKQKKRSDRKQDISGEIPCYYTPYLPPCRICGDTASGLHYGVNTCEACKAFFRRSLSHKTQYNCLTANNNCSDVRSCAFCRYRKCLAEGMSKTAIKQGRYSHSTRTKTIHEVQKIRKGTEPAHNDPDVDTLNPVPSPILPGLTEDSVTIPSPIFTHTDLLDETDDPNKPVDVWNSGECVVVNEINKTVTLYTTKRNLSSNVPSIGNGVNKETNGIVVNNVHQSRARTKRLSTKKVLKEKQSDCEQLILAKKGIKKENEFTLFSESEEKLMEDLIQKISAASKRYNPLEVMKDSDSACPRMEHKQREFAEQIRLRDEIFGDLRPLPRDEYLHFLALTGIDIDNRQSLIEDVLRSLEHWLIRFINFAKTIPGFTTLSLDDQSSLIKASRLEFWFWSNARTLDPDSRVAVSANGEPFFLDDLARIYDPGFLQAIVDFTRQFSPLGLAQEEIAILKAICITFSDRTPLSDPAAVERVQWPLVQCLQFLMRKNHKDGEKAFYKAWDRVIGLRNLTDYFDKVTEELVIDWPSQLEKRPILRDLFQTANS